MTDGAKPRGSVRTPFDSQFEKERSDVHSLSDGSEGQRPSGTYQAADNDVKASTFVRESMAERTARIDHKMTIATMLLSRLGPVDARARLLSSALLRRDEVLLDAILESMVDEVVDLVPKDRKPSM